jgi:hypothetical protein
MNALAEHLAASHFNMKQFVRTVMSSGLSTRFSADVKLSDDRFYTISVNARFQLLKRSLQAGPDEVQGCHWGRGHDIPRRVSRLPQTRLRSPAEIVCVCDVAGPELASAAHTLNGDILASRLTPTGRISNIAANSRPRNQTDLISHDLPTDAGGVDECDRLPGIPRERLRRPVVGHDQHEAFLFVQ